MIQSCETVESLWDIRGVDMISIPGSNPIYVQTIANATGTARLLINSSDRTKTRGVRALLFNKDGVKEVDHIFPENSPIAWTDRELGTAFDCIKKQKNIATDPVFANEIGADFAVRGKFARRGRNLLILCQEIRGAPPKKRFLSIHVTDEMRRNVSMLLPKGFWAL